MKTCALRVVPETRTLRVGFSGKCPFNHLMNGAQWRTEEGSLAAVTRAPGEWRHFPKPGSGRWVELCPKRETSGSPPTAQLLMNAGRGEPLCRVAPVSPSLCILLLDIALQRLAVSPLDTKKSDYLFFYVSCAPRDSQRRNGVSVSSNFTSCKRFGSKQGWKSSQPELFVSLCAAPVLCSPRGAVTRRSSWYPKCLLENWYLLCKTSGGFGPRTHRVRVKRNKEEKESVAVWYAAGRYAKAGARDTRVRDACWLQSVVKFAFHWDLWDHSFLF